MAKGINPAKPIDKPEFDSYIRSIARCVESIRSINTLLRSKGCAYVVYIPLHAEAMTPQIKVTTERGALHLPTDTEERTTIVGYDRSARQVTETIEHLIDYTAGSEVVTMQEYRHRAMTEKEIETLCANMSPLQSGQR